MVHTPSQVALSMRYLGLANMPCYLEKLSDSPVPTMVVAGELDEKFVNFARVMEKCGPNVSCVKVKGAGHNVVLEQPFLFVEFVSDFLSE